MDGGDLYTIIFGDPNVLISYPLTARLSSEQKVKWISCCCQDETVGTVPRFMGFRLEELSTLICRIDSTLTKWKKLISKVSSRDCVSTP